MKKNSISKRFHAIAVLGMTAMLLQGCHQKIDARQTRSINGLVYKLNDSDPFSGTVTGAALSMYPGPGCVAEFTKGLLDGNVTCAFDNGIKLVESHWKEGKRDGTEKFYWLNTDQLRRSAQWSGDELDGQEQVFNAKGALVSQIHWENGHKSGNEKVWDVTGKTLLVDLDWKDGLQTGVDKSGEQERNFKDGKVDGVQQHYAIDQFNPAWMNTGNEFSVQAQLAQTIGGGTTSASMYKDKGYYVDTEDQYSNGVLVSSIKHSPPSSRPSASQEPLTSTQPPEAGYQAATVPQAASPASPAPQPVAATNHGDTGRNNAPFSPGFNCAKVSGTPERLICSDRDLSALDVELNRVFAIALERTVDQRGLNSNESAWVKSTRNVCTEKSCMVRAYQQRISDLSH